MHGEQIINIFMDSILIPRSTITMTGRDSSIVSGKIYQLPAKQREYKCHALVSYVTAAATTGIDIRRGDYYYS